jgi:plasmid stability protein
MPVNLSIKNAPDRIVSRLRERAKRNHRSLQGELLAIIEEAAEARTLVTPKDVLAEVRRLKLRTPAESAEIVRRDRNGR